MDEDLLKRITAAGLPVHNLSGLPIFYNDGNDDLLVWNKTSPGRCKAVVISLPRSGTHFTSTLLEHLGLVYGGIHVSPKVEDDVVQDRRCLKLNQQGRPYWQEYALDVADLFRLVGPGQFVQGHVPFNAKNAAALADFKIVLAKRNLRDVAVSAMRFVASLSARGMRFRGELDVRWCPLPDGPDKMLAYLASFGEGIAIHARRIRPWQELPNTFVVDFDVLTGDDAPTAAAAIAALAEFLGTTVDAQAAELIRAQSIGCTTPTWTGKLSDWRRLWSDEVEAAFQRIVLAPEHAGPAAPLEPLEPFEAFEAAGDADAARRHAGRLLAGAGAVRRFDLAGRHFLADGVRTSFDGARLNLAGACADTAHKHITFPVDIGELCLTTLEVRLPARQTARHFMLQMGNDAGFFNSYFDGAGIQVTDSASCGASLGVCSAIRPLADGELVLSLAGIVGPGKDCYARIYLCGENGQLHFDHPVALSVSRVSLLSGAGIASIFDPNAAGRQR
jgi:hypothetical protein